MRTVDADHVGTRAHTVDMKTAAEADQMNGFARATKRNGGLEPGAFNFDGTIMCTDAHSVAFSMCSWWR